MDDKVRLPGHAGLQSPPNLSTASFAKAGLHR
jgi:hypothetical protein